MLGCMGGWKRVGYVDCEMKSEIAWIGLVVSPAIHNKGYGKRILNSFITLMPLRGGQRNACKY